MIAVFLVVYGFLAGYLMYEYLNLRREHAELREKLLQGEQLMSSISQDHPMLVNADLLFSRQLKEITAQLVSMDNQLQGLENKRDNDGGYQHALRILEMGGEKSEIVNSCHLSNAEADLLMNLHAYRKAIKVPS